MVEKMNVKQKLTYVVIKIFVFIIPAGIGYSFVKGDLLGMLLLWLLYFPYIGLMQVFAAKYRIVPAWTFWFKGLKTWFFGIPPPPNPPSGLTDYTSAESVDREIGNKEF